MPSVSGESWFACLLTQGGAIHYAWRDKADPFSDGRVHVKVTVADGRVCFITSANLTGHAMEKNMEAGVLISGEHIAELLHEHFVALISTKVVVAVWACAAP